MIHPAGSGRQPRRVAHVLGAALLAMLAVGLAGAGVLGLVAAGRGGGYIDLGTDTRGYRTDGYALTSDGWDASKELLGTLDTLRIRFVPADRTRPVFLGLARPDQVRRYLSGVRYTTVRDTGGVPVSSDHPGTAPTIPPGAESWAASASGAGPQTLTWRIRSGDWALVAMNADGSPSVGGRVQVAASVKSLPEIAVGFLLAGVLLAVVSGLVVRRGRQPRDPEIHETPTAQTAQSL